MEYNPPYNPYNPGPDRVLYYNFKYFNDSYIKPGLPRNKSCISVSGKPNISLLSAMKINNFSTFHTRHNSTGANTPNLLKPEIFRQTPIKNLELETKKIENSEIYNFTKFWKPNFIKKSKPRKRSVIKNQFITVRKLPTISKTPLKIPISKKSHCDSLLKKSSKLRKNCDNTIFMRISRIKFFSGANTRKTSPENDRVNFVFAQSNKEKCLFLKKKMNLNKSARLNLLANTNNFNENISENPYIIQPNIKIIYKIL